MTDGCGIKMKYMKACKKWYLVCLLLLLAAGALRAEGLVYRVEVRDEVGPSMWRMVKRAFEESRREGADAVLLHMNTYGGMVVYADSLRSLVLDSPVPVWVWVDNNAASAGALIALACDRIYMREGANIGAATVVNTSGEAMPDKYQSYMRSMIRATAQAQGRDTVRENGRVTVRWKRDPRIAEAMVDERISIEGVTDSGQVVTFTPHEAMRHGFCDGMAESVEEVLHAEGVEGYTVRAYEPTTMDAVVGFLINPVLRGLLVMIIVGGIYFELQTPGVGFPLAAAVGACLLYFAPLYVEGLAGNWEIVAFVVGVLLLLLEVFVIPGFGVAGISGIVLVVGALVMAGIDDVPWEFVGDFVYYILESLLLVVGASLGALVLSMWLGAKMLGSRRWAFALHAEQRTEDGFVGVDMSGCEAVGKVGVTLTDLRPGGKVAVNKDVYDAVSLAGEYIEKGKAVSVAKCSNGQVYVEELKD